MKNPHKNPLPVPQVVNPVINQQMCNGGNVAGFIPNNNNNMPPSCFMNLPNNQPFSQFPNGSNPHHNFTPLNQFNPSQQQQLQQLQQQQQLQQLQLQQQQQGQFFPMNPAYNQNVGEQALVQNTIQNIYQLLQLQNPQRPPMFQNQIPNVITQQFVMSNPNPNPHPHPLGGVQGNPFLNPSLQTHQPHNLPNFQNQIVQGVGPQNQNFPTNQPFGMANANANGPVQQRMMDVNASKQVANTGNHPGRSTLTNIQNNHGNVPTNANGRWRPESQNKNFTGHKRNEASHSHKGFKSQFHHTKHAKDKSGVYNGNMINEGNSHAAVDSSFENKVPFLNYSEQEIKQWREARKKNYPTSVTLDKKKCTKEETLSDVTNQEAILRRQQLKEILAKQAELGCEVAEIPPSYLSASPYPSDKHNNNSRDKKQERKKGKFHKKRGTRFKDKRKAKRTKGGGDQDSFNLPSNQREPSLLHKLLTRDIKRDKNYILQVLRFIAVNNSFFNDNKSLRFPSVIVRETNPQETTFKGNDDKVEEEEGEITE